MRGQTIRDNRFIKPVSTKKVEGAVLDLTLQETKDWLIVTHNEDDTVIQRIIDAAVMTLESYCKRPFTPTEVTVYMDFCKNPLYFPRLPAISVTDVSIKVDRGYTGYESLPLDDYEVFADELILETTGIVYLRYTAGYGPGELPEAIKLALLHEIAYRYENRGDKNLDLGISEAAETYLRPYVITQYTI